MIEMDMPEIIKSRRSVRTFDGTPLTAEHKAKLEEFISTISAPYDIPIEFVLLEKEKYGLSSPVISGESMYVAAKSKAVPHSEEAFGYAFEQLVLFAWSLGIGTTWIGGTMKREIFEKAVQLQDGERMYCVSPLGYPAAKMSFKEKAMRTAIQADKRKAAKELFFENSFSTPINDCDEKISTALEAVRLAPSAVNKQPWRIIRCGNDFHFYEKHSKGYISEQGDMQKIDMGIALFHFMNITDGKLGIAEPDISAPTDIEYIATVTV